jgi:glycerophosphoryl diester phosphodiesterase
MRLGPLAVLLGAIGAVGAASAKTTLTGFAALPAQTLSPGTPPAGGYADDGSKLAVPRFASQPVQGVSAIAPVAVKAPTARNTERGRRQGPAETPVPKQWWALSDNGFGTRANSGDYRLVLYRFRVEPARAPAKPERRSRRPERRKPTPAVTVLQRIELRDPGRFFPWELTLAADPRRPLTGADADPESLVLMPDGSFWVGDEHGPWLLHFSANGILLEAPVELVPGGTVLRSASHPDVAMAGKTSRIAISKGFEGLAPGPQPNTLVAALEAPIAGDIGGEVRLLEYDLAQRAWSGRQWSYPLDSAGNSVAELVRDPFGAADSYLVIERDALQGAGAKFKKIFRVRLSRLPEKTLAVDLLDIDDPQRLAGGSTRFRFPFLTPESVWPIGPREWVVVNDNNFPAAGGRSALAPDPTEWIVLRE